MFSYAVVKDQVFGAPNYFDISRMVQSQITVNLLITLSISVDEGCLKLAYFLWCIIHPSGVNFPGSLIELLENF